jgi:hypothetical protein
MGRPFGTTAWPPVPRIWPGATCVIAGSGPSLTDEDIEYVRQARERSAVKLIVINTTYRLAPWADMLYACDGRWWDQYKPDFHGLKVSPDARAVEYGAVRVPGEDLDGLSFDPLRIHFGANSAYQALNVAVLMGVKRVLFLGLDMTNSGGSHWHGDHPNGLNNPSDHMTETWRRKFATTPPDLAKAGVEVINCSRHTALECFPRRPLENVL